MADTQFVSKSRLISLIKKAVSGQKTGLISVLTDTQHAVLLKFAEGKLIHSYSRGRDIGAVIQILNECFSVKFNFAPIPMENASELMPIDTFIQLMEAGNSDDNETYTSLTLPNVRAQNNGPTEQLRHSLTEITSEYLGPIAEMMVDEAFERSSDPVPALEYIAELIPDAKQAAKFLAAAAKLLV